MSTTTLDARLSGEAVSRIGATSRLQSVWSRIFARMIAGQERRARRFVNAYLAGMTDAEIIDLGFGDRLTEIRATPRDARVYWS
jgi:hypothetical protein